MTRRRAALLATLLAASLGACAPTAGGPGTSPTPTPSGSVIPAPPTTIPPSSSASSSAAPTADADVPPEILAFQESVQPHLEALDGVEFTAAYPLMAVCNGEMAEAASVQVQTTGNPSAEQVLAIMDTAYQAAQAEAPGMRVSLQISPDALSSAQFLCGIPQPDETVAQVVADGFAAEWVFTLVAPITEAGTVSEADPAERVLIYSPNAKMSDSDAEVLALLPDTWDAAVAGAEALGWEWAYIRMGGGMLIDGLIPAQVGSQVPDGLADFWTDWSEFGWDVVGAGAELHPYVSPADGGGLDVLLTLKEGVEELLPDDQADFDELIQRMGDLGLGDVTVEIATAE